MSTPEFLNNLTSFLKGQEHRDLVASPGHDDMLRLIEYLDAVLDTIPATGPPSRKCLRELRETCGSSGILPRSCMFPGPAPITAEWPMASSGPYDVHEGLVGDTKVSVKRLRMYLHDEQGGHKRGFCEEAVVWRHSVHPNIVPLLGVTFSPFQLISPWMAGGELSAYIGANPSANRVGLLSDIAVGLNFLHCRGIVHGDLKGPSILVDDKGRARLTDFSLSAVVTDSDLGGPITEGYAVRWAGPEILDDRMSVSKMSDVYSFSMVMIEVFTGEAPYYGIAPATVAVSVLDGMRPSRPTHPDLTNDIWELVERCWNQEPRYRPDISEVVLRLQNHTRDLRCDRAEVPDDQTTDNTTLMSVRGDGSSIGLCPQPPRWTPISRVLQTLSGFVRLPSMPRFVSGAENVRNAGSEHGAPASDPSRRERSWFSGCNPFRRSESGSERIKTEVDTRHAIPNGPRSRSHKFGPRKSI